MGAIPPETLARRKSNTHAQTHTHTCTHVRTHAHNRTYTHTHTHTSNPALHNTSRHCPGLHSTKTAPPTPNKKTHTHTHSGFPMDPTMTNNVLYDSFVHHVNLPRRDSRARSWPPLNGRLRVQKHLLGLLCPRVRHCHTCLLVHHWHLSQHRHLHFPVRRRLFSEQAAAAPFSKPYPLCVLLRLRSAGETPG